jgi:outer membrane protein TolC
VRNRFAFSPVVALAFAACATPPPPAPGVTPESAAANFTARSLADTALHRFLAENLGHDPAPSTSSGQAGAWDFEALAWTAFYFHPSLEFARAQWATARAMQQTASARPNPTVSLVPGYNTTREPGLSPWFPAINFDFLLQGNKRAHQQDVARADAEIARLAVVTAVWQVRSDVRRALIDFNTATARERGLAAQAAVQEKLTALLGERFAAGRATATETSATRLAAMKSAAALLDARAQIAAARARLATALGLPAAALDNVRFSAPPAPALPSETLATARRESLQSRADVLAALAKVASAHAALELEYAKQQPDFHLGPGYQWDQGANKWSLALTFELPIFHRNEGPIAEATARRGEAVALFNAAQASAIAAIDAAALAQSAAAAQVEQARRVRDESAAQLARAQQRLDLGAADQVERQLAKLELAAADAALADADSAAALAAGQLEDALQLPFPHLAALADVAHAQPTRTP